MSDPAAIQFRCPICESQRFKPVSWAPTPGGPISQLYECASCSFTFTDPLRFARKRAAMRTKPPADASAAVGERRTGIPRDRRMVNIDDEDEVQYWCSEFQCTEWRLLDAVTFVGTMTDDIKGCISKGVTIRRRH
jgi:hypothetical protein